MLWNLILTQSGALPLSFGQKLSDIWNVFVQWFWATQDRLVAAFVTGDRWKLFFDGLWVTLRITLGAALLGIVLGVLLAFMKLSKKSDGRKTIFTRIATIYLDVIRGTPVVVQLMILYFALLRGVENKMLVLILAFGMNSGAYVAEIVRSGIQSIDRGQAEAARSLGLSNRKAMQYIVIPQAFKNVLPALGNEIIVLMKETAIVGYVGMQDLMKAGMYVLSKTYDAFPPLIGVAVVYFVVIKIFSLGLARFERWLQKSDSR